MNKELKRLLQEQREQEHYHLPMEKEFDFYRKIASGDIESIEKMDASGSEGRGILSKNPLRNEKYHAIILIAMITRFCVEAGLGSEEAFTLSDMYIRKIDELSDANQIHCLQNQAVGEFTHMMHDLQTRNINTLQVVRGMEYIEKNLTNPITSKDVGDAVGSNSDYLSRLFKKELGIPLGDYILKRKCTTACYMLENSDETITDIAVFLGFASTSHFIERFKKCMGITPERFRKDKSFSK